jgi:hypothetical protein
MPGPIVPRKAHGFLPLQGLHRALIPLHPPQVMPAHATSSWAPSTRSGQCMACLEWPSCPGRKFLPEEEHGRVGTLKEAAMNWGANLLSLLLSSWCQKVNPWTSLSSGTMHPQCTPELSAIPPSECNPNFSVRAHNFFHPHSTPIPLCNIAGVLIPTPNRNNAPSALHCHWLPEP